MSGLFFAALGFGALNYTNAFGYSHHVAWAVENEFPRPSESIFYWGLGCAVGGGWLFGLGMRRKRKAE
ncbi:MAG: hypothetical protein ACYSU1_02885 [Planctomycetota bacterium]